MFTCGPAFFGAKEGAGGDPDFASVGLLMHMDGVNGGTSFPEVTGATVTRGGSTLPTTSTAQSKFGGASALFSTAGGYLSIPHAAKVNAPTGDFTIEFWLRRSGFTGSPAVLYNKANGTGAYPYQVYLDAANQLVFRGLDAAGTSTVFTCQSTTVISTSAWYHVACVRQGSTFRLFVDGVQESAGSSAAALFNNSFPVYLGAFSTGGNVYLGYMDDVRFTKVARYTANFTPPSSAFPDF
jgi:hypothetical protein